MSELWSLAEGQWQRDPGSGRFSVHTFRGLGPPSPKQHPADLARLVGARAEAAAGAIDWFPGEFAHSPQTGRPLSPVVSASQQQWLPPYGNTDPLSIGFNGLRRTDAAIEVRTQISPESRPDQALPLPPPGDFHFFVGTFNLVADSLIAIEFSRGFLFAWLPGPRQWVEIEARAVRLPESSLPREAWGMCVSERAGVLALFMPSDLGLVRLEVDLLALTYRATITPGRCVGAPAVAGGMVSVPILEADGSARLLAAPETDLSRIERFPIERPPQGGFYQLPLSDRTQAIWMSGDGMLTFRPASAGTPHDCGFRSWPQDMTPEFQFGCAYLSNTGRLWQLCLHQREERFAYVHVGRQEIYNASGPRLCAGKVTYHLEAQSRADPWLDAGMEHAQMDEIVLPLLESVSANTVMCLRVSFVGSLAEFFAQADAQVATLELAGERSARLQVVRVTAPWLAAVFVYDGFIYFYHPGLQGEIPGWKLLPP